MPEERGARHWEKRSSEVLNRGENGAPGNVWESLVLQSRRKIGEECLLGHKAESCENDARSVGPSVWEGRGAQRLFIGGGVSLRKGGGFAVSGPGKGDFLRRNKESRA